MWLFISLHRHFQSIFKYLDGEFAKIVNGLRLLGIFAKAFSGMPDMVPNMFVIYLFYLNYDLFTYYFIYLFIYFLFINLCV